MGRSRKYIEEGRDIVSRITMARRPKINGEQ